MDAASYTNSEVFWAIATAAFFGFFRLGELILTAGSQWDQKRHLSWGDVAVDSYTVKQSKCDQFGRGVDVILGATHSDVCPVQAMLKYTAQRGEGPGPFFLLQDSGLALFLKRLHSAVGLPQSSFAGHSFRIGAATTAALAGLEDSLIQKMRPWSSSAFLVYLKTPRSQLAAVAGQLASLP